jgi:6-phosphogluconolactonase
MSEARQAATTAPEERRFETRAELNQALAGEIVARLSEAVNARGGASFVASGGTTPGPLYDLLCKTAAPWERVTVTLADERWVGLDNPMSNARLVRTRLIRDRASRAKFIGLKTAHAEPELAEPDVDAALRAIARPFDMVLLGLGENGHTASLFPHGLGLAAALNLAEPALSRAIRPVAPDDPVPPRMSLSLRAILDSRRIALLFTGEAKWTVYRQALEAGDALAMPVRAVLHQKLTPVQVWWAP